LSELTLPSDSRLTVDGVFRICRFARSISYVRKYCLFRGVAGDPDQIGEDFLSLSFTNKLSLQRIPVPDVRIQRSCPWTFPATLGQRQEGLTAVT